MKGRVGILTVVNCNNNGTDIQALAMQLMLKHEGINAQVIDYAAPKWETSPYRTVKSIRDFASLPAKLFMRYSHKRFREKYIIRSDKRYRGEELKTLPYDVIVVGSDQIWNLTITGADLNFFLPYSGGSFLKMSYAVSFGKQNLLEDEKLYALSKYLNQFVAVSVRETSAIAALAQIGVTARNDLDPVLMIEGRVWTEIAVPCCSKRKYILLYLVEYNAEALEYAREYSRQHNCQIVWLTDSLKWYKGICVKRFTGVERWLGYMSEAALVITNSYHGLAMAICMNRPFLVVPLLNNKQSNVRMLDLLSKLSLEHHVLNSRRNAEFHWENVNKRLESLRKESYKYLKENIML